MTDKLTFMDIRGRFVWFTQVLAIALCIVAPAYGSGSPVMRANGEEGKGSLVLLVEQPVFNSVPKRKASDPIYVSLAPLVLDFTVRQADQALGVVAEHLRNELSSDPVIRLVAVGLDESGQSTTQEWPSIADVEVTPRIVLKSRQNLPRQAGKPGTKMAALIFEATITSRAPAATYRVTESGQVKLSLEVSKRFARRVRQTIVEQIGPQIPAN